MCKQYNDLQQTQDLLLIESMFLVWYNARFKSCKRSLVHYRNCTAVKMRMIELFSYAFTLKFVASHKFNKLDWVCTYQKVGGYQ